MLQFYLQVAASSTLACRRVADLLSQLELSVAEALQPELAPPGGGVRVAPQHKGCHHKRHALLVCHCPGHIQGRVFVTPEGCAHPV